MKVYNLPKSCRPTEPAVWLQEVGWVEAKPAKDLIPGEKRVYNYGYFYTIRSVVTAGKWVSIELVDDYGKVYYDKKRPDTLVPFAR